MVQGVYKAGQGYWVRVLTAVFTGVLVLAGGAWAWKQGALIRPPIESWRLTLRSVQSPPALGDRVEFVGPNSWEQAHRRWSTRSARSSDTRSSTSWNRTR